MLFAGPKDLKSHNLSYDLKASITARHLIELAYLVRT